MSEGIDNQAHRITTLKHIITHLHEGHAPGQVRQQLSEIVRQTDPSEVIAMEQQLISEGMPVEEVRSMCDLHSQVTRDILKQRQNRPELPPGHPAETFQRENEALRGVIKELRTTIADLRPLTADDDAGPILLRLRQSFSSLMDIDKHYKRKEQVLFPCLERHGITGPSKVMWAKDDEVRSLLAAAGKLLAQNPDAAELRNAAVLSIERTNAAIEEMIYKEENILLPMALDTLTADEWAKIWQSSPVYGWCLIEPGRAYKPASALKPMSSANPLAVTLSTGSVTVEQLEAIFSTMPLDLTFVDTNDRVAFFTEGPERIFPRSRAIIGRKVQYCHPVNSIDLVDRILGDFRSGARDVAEFWIHMKDKYLHIRFFALRDEQKRYLGTLEFVQDIAPLQKIEGERRLLAEDHPATSATA
jgi:DUF438 domain-containing protein